MRKIIFIVSAAAYLPASIPASAFSAEIMSFGDTYGVVAGVLSWRDKSFTVYPVGNRKDKELYDTLVARGALPDNFALLLDTAATRDAVYAAVKDKASKAPPGSTFIFYYAGHGVNRERGGVFFANYDIQSGKAKETGLSPEVLGNIIAQNFKGARAVLLADCCYSGALQLTARELSKSSVAAAALTSASASNTSAGTWTFSQTVIDALNGRALLDRDNDGFITFGELSEDIAGAMKYRERQLSGSFVPEKMRGTAISADSGRYSGRISSGAFSVGEYVGVLGEGGSRTAQVLGFVGDRCSVEFYDYSDKTVSAESFGALSKIEFGVYPAGKDVTVLWGTKPYAAKILEVRDSFHLITYPGWSHSWDEWVMSDRILGPVAGGGTTAAPAGEQVSAEWQGDCYPAVVLEKQEGRAFIHYAGYGPSWDEWVGPERLDCRK